MGRELVMVTQTVLGLIGGLLVGVRWERLV